MSQRGRRKDEITWHVERLDWENAPFSWVTASKYPNAFEATEAAKRCLASWGGKWRVVRVTKALISEWP